VRLDIRELWCSPAAGRRWQQRPDLRPPTRCKTPRFMLEAHKAQRRGGEHVKARARPSSRRARVPEGCPIKNFFAGFLRPRSRFSHALGAQRPRGAQACLLSGIILGLARPRRMPTGPEDPTLSLVRSRGEGNTPHPRNEAGRCRACNHASHARAVTPGRRSCRRRASCRRCRSRSSACCRRRRRPCPARTSGA